MVFIIPLFPKGIYQTHDAQANIARFAAYFKSFTNLQIPPRWAEDLNYGYGSPIFIFYYPLPGYISSALHFLGVDFTNSFKILTSLSLILSAFSFYLWSSILFKPKIALFASLIYALSPYHLLDLYVRGDIGELLALSIIPLVFFFLEKIFKKPSIRNISICAITYALVLLSHNSVRLFLYTRSIFIHILKI